MTQTVQVDRSHSLHTKTHFRPDIQGLRAVAVLLVLFFHIEIDLFSGGYVGVDIFFVISGFLITGHLIRSGKKSGRIDLWDFYAGRIRRILPAATVVLLFTAITTVIILPITRWEKIGIAIIASAVYLVNWVFARNTDYLNAETAPTPIQHFWTLAVEEQFYILWPLALVILLFILRKWAYKKGKNADAVQGLWFQRYVGIGAIFLTLSSFLFSVYFSAIWPSISYFVTPTRLWELGIGAIIAAYSPRFEEIGARLGYFLGGLGLLSILAASILFDSATVFPGYAALLPTLGAAGVIIGGMSGRAEKGIGNLLKIPLMRWIGDLSYSLYLWHWPIIVFATYLLGGSFTRLQGVALLVISFLPSWLSYRYIEDPVRNWSYVKNNSKKAIKLGAVFMSISVLAGLGVLGVLTSAKGAETQSPFSDVMTSGHSASMGRLNSAQLIGAEVLTKDPAAGRVVDYVTGFYPGVLDASGDLPDYYLNGCDERLPGIHADECSAGIPDSDFIVALVGDSHAGHWASALEPIAIANGWRLEIITKNACPLISTAVTRSGSDEFHSPCYKWNERVLEYLTGDQAPDYVLTSNSFYKPAQVSADHIRTGSIPEGLASGWARLEEAQVPLVVLVDTPRPDIDVPDCVAGYNGELEKCAIPLNETTANGAADQRMAIKMTGVSSIDLSEYICPDGYCVPVIGNVLVWRDGHHLTATYSRSLAEVLENQLKKTTELPFKIRENGSL